MDLSACWRLLKKPGGCHSEARRFDRAEESAFVFHRGSEEQIPRCARNDNSYD